ncbi:hypothetical protein AGR7B_Cc10264 [Agrobacterium deltaense RV3]|nr:hypothetical protein AGR7B_Cc10264 [Agrobacterium deltaense RV3]
MPPASAGGTVFFREGTNGDLLQHIRFKRNRWTFYN